MGSETVASSPEKSYSMEIYIHRADEDFGPYSAETARDFIEKGIFHSSDYGWCDGLTEWKPVGELLGPAPEKVAAPSLPVPPSTVPVAQAYVPSYQSTVLRSARRPRKAKKSGKMIALNLALVAIAAFAADFRFGNGRALSQRYLAVLGIKLGGTTEAGPQAQPTPAPVVAPPVAVRQETAPAPEPAAPEPAATPAPPKAFDPADLAANPAAWPKTVMLKEAAVFPAVYNGQVVGNVTVPEGTMVNLVGIKGDQVELEYRGGGKRLLWKLTDLEQRTPKP